MARLLDTTTTAERTGIARATLAKMRLRGGGPPFVKIGKAVLYSESDLDAWIEAQPRHQATAEYAVSTGKPRGRKPKTAA